MLSKGTYRVANYIYKNPNVTREALYREFDKDIESSVEFLSDITYLIQNKYLMVGKNTSNNSSIEVYRLTPSGRSAREEHLHSRIEFRLTQGFALVGTILSIIALMKS